QARGGLRLPVTDLNAALETVASGTAVEAVDLRALGEGVWTAISLADPDAPPLILLASDNWTILDRTINPFAASLALALRCVRERERRHRAERVLVDGYTMARRLSRLGGVDTVSQRIVAQVARSIAAERVALALYRPEEDCLVIAATHGYPASVVKD